MRRMVFAGVGLLLGFVLVAIGGVMLAEVARITQAEGAYLMNVFFFWAPLGAVVGGLAGILMAR
jgi:hypothetical protein